MANDNDCLLFLSILIQPEGVAVASVGQPHARSLMWKGQIREIRTKADEVHTGNLNNDVRRSYCYSFSDAAVSPLVLQQGEPSGPPYKKVGKGVRDIDCCSEENWLRAFVDPPQRANRNST
jgi:hypothetical protein